MKTSSVVSSELISTVVRNLQVVRIICESLLTISPFHNAIWCLNLLLSLEANLEKVDVWTVILHVVCSCRWL